MAEWRVLALCFVVLGFELDVLALANHNFVGSEAIVATNICAFLCFLVAFLLILLVKFGQIQGSRATLIFATVFTFAAAVLIIVGLILYRDRRNVSLPPYHTTLLVCAAAFGVGAAIFSLIDICKH